MWLDFVLCQSGPEKENTCISLCFRISQNQQEPPQPIFKSWWSQLVGSPGPKRCVLTCIFTWFVSLSRKEGHGCKTSIYLRAGSSIAPRGRKKAEYLYFDHVPLSRMRAKKWPHNRISRGKVPNLFGALVPRRGLSPACLQCFLVFKMRKLACL